MRTLLISAAIALLILASQTAAEVRTWKARSGGFSIEAEFVSSKDGKVTLKRTNGTLAVVPLEKLSDADREIIERETAKPDADAKSEPDAKAAATGPVTIGDTTIEVRSLQIFRPAPPAREPKGEAGIPNMAIPMGNDGTALSLSVVNPKQNIIGMDEKKSRIGALTDEKQTNLLPASKRDDEFGGSLFGPLQARVSPGGHECMLEIKAPKIPARGATKIRLDATIVLQCGAEEKTVEQKGLAIQKGTKITVGPAPMTISSVDGGFGEAKMMVSFESKQPTHAIKKVEFLAANGSLIKHHPFSEGQGGFGDNVTYTASFGFMEKVDSVTIKLTYFSKVEELTLPLKMDVGLGL